MIFRVKRTLMHNLPKINIVFKYHEFGNYNAKIQYSGVFSGINLIIVVITELTGYCDVHLINDGLTIDGQTATIQVQGTGPSAANRITEFQCLFDSGDVFSCKLKN